MSTIGTLFCCLSKPNNHNSRVKKTDKENEAAVELQRADGIYIAKKNKDDLNRYPDIPVAEYLSIKDASKLREVSMYWRNHLSYSLYPHVPLRHPLRHEEQLSLNASSTSEIPRYKFDASITLEGHTDSVTSLTKLSNKKIISGSEDNTIKIWNQNTGICLSTLEGHTERVTSVAVLPNGNIVSGSFDNTIKIWDQNTGICLHTLEGHTDKVTSIAILPNRNIASGSFDNTIKIWDQNTGNCLNTLEGHTERITSIAILPNGNIVSGSFDNTIKIWDQNTGNCLHTLEGHTERITSIAVLPNGNIVSGSFDNTIKIWDQNTGNCLRSLAKTTENGNIVPGRVTSVAVLPNGNIVAGYEDNTIKIWNQNTGNCLSTLAKPTKNRNIVSDSVTSVDLLPKGSIVAGYEDKTIKIWGNEDIRKKGKDEFDSKWVKFSNNRRNKIWMGMRVGCAAGTANSIVCFKSAGITAFPIAATFTIAILGTVAIMPIAGAFLGRCIADKQNNPEKNKLNKNAIMIQKVIRKYRKNKLNKNAIMIQKVIRGHRVRQVKLVEPASIQGHAGANVI